MKAVVLVAALVAAACAQTLPQTCSTVAFGGFCSDVSFEVPPVQLEGHSTDFVIGTISATIESALGTMWPTVTEAFNKAVQDNGAEVCSECITAVKRLTCASTVPKCGYLNCWVSKAVAAAQCVEDCPCSGGESPDLNDGRCSVCLKDCWAALLIDGCQDYLLNRLACAEFARVCGCVGIEDSRVATICAYFPESAGYYVKLDDLASCQGKRGWCQAAESALEKRSSTACVETPGGCLSGAQAGGNSGQVANPFGNANSGAVNVAATLLIALGLLAALVL